MKNFKSEIGCVIVFKMLIYRKIRGYLEMTNENVRFFSSFFSTKLLQKREMRKDIVIELSYKGFSRASDYS